MKTRKSFIVGTLLLGLYIVGDYWLWASGVITPGQFCFGLSILLVLCCMGVIHLLSKRGMLGLLLAAAIGYESQAQVVDPPLSFCDEQQQPGFTLCEAAFGIAIVGAAGYCLYRFCTARFWTNIPPPNPPPQPPQAGGTNGGTHRTWISATLVASNPPTSMPPIAAFNMAGNPVPDLWDGKGAMFTLAYYGRYPWQSSPDLQNWQDFTFAAWASSAGTLSVIYDAAGVPVQTNYAPLFYDGQSRSYIPPLRGFWVDPAVPARFYRYRSL